MKIAIILLTTFISFHSFSQSRKVEKISNKMNLFLNFDYIETISSIHAVDKKKSGLELNINSFLNEYELQNFSNDGSQLIILIKRYKGSTNKILNVDFEIIDLTNNGRAVGGANYSTSIVGKKPSVLAEALVYGIKKQLE